MLEVGWTEMLVIAIVLIIVVGPKDLPGMLRTFGRTVTQLRSMAGDFRKQFDEALKEAELDEVRKTVDDARKLNPTKSLRDAMNPLRQAGEDIRNDLQKATRSPTVAKKDPSAPKAGEDADGSSDGGNAAAGAAKPASVAKPASKPETAAVASANSGTPPPAEPVAGTAGRLEKDAPRTAAAKPTAGTASKKPAGVASAKAPAAKKAAPRKTGATRKTAAKAPSAKKPASSAKTAATKKSDKTGAEGA